MKTIAIPLARLRLAETNMRTSHRSAGLEELKASLLVHGQLQPIVVTRAPDGDGFAVVAGARRTLAARALVAEGKWPDTARLAAVRRRAGKAEARELSLAENLQRVAPCAADEALAFARLVGDGADPAALAARFGRPVRYVRQRLALAALSPVVLEALRDGRVPLAVAEALTLSASHARQEELLERVLDCPPADAARYVREALRRVLLSADHALPGVLDAYAAAGGTLTRDLFDGADGGLVDDPGLFLACQRAVLEAEAERRRDGWAFVEVQDGPQAWSWRGAFSHAVPSLTPEQQALLTRLKRELERPDLTAAERALLEERLDAIEPEYDRSACGVVAVLAPDGAVQWVEGLRRREPDPTPAEEDDLPPWEDSSAGGAVAAETPEEPKLSAAVREQLGAVRTASLQAAVLGTPAMALRLACFALLAPGAGPCGLFGAAHRFPTGAREQHVSQAWRRVEEAWAAWAGRPARAGGGRLRRRSAGAVGSPRRPGGRPVRPVRRPGGAALPSRPWRGRHRPGGGARARRLGGGRLASRSGIPGVLAQGADRRGRPEHRTGLRPGHRPVAQGGDGRAGRTLPGACRRRFRRLVRPHGRRGVGLPRHPGSRPRGGVLAAARHRPSRRCRR